MGRQRSTLAKNYRLTFVEDQTHRRIWSYRFSKLTLIVACITAFVVFLGLFYSIFAFTPLKTVIPGYPDAHSKRLAVSNAIKIDSLESVITRWQLYSENLARVLSGQETLSLDSLVKGNMTKYLQNKSAEELRRQDSVLRATVAEEEKYDVSADRKRILPIEGVHFFPPVKGVVSRGFDLVTHPGIDITAPSGSLVLSVLDGTVVFAGWNDEAGYTIQIQHPGNIISTYKHNLKLLKSTGDKVAAGTPIGLAGKTEALPTGDYLHFELWYNGEAVNPERYIKF